VMVFWACNPAVLRGYAMEALTRVRSKTHRAMHAERSRIIARHLVAKQTFLQNAHKRTPDVACQ
jgi:hypothetical protein